MAQTGTELIIATGGTYIQFERDKTSKLSVLSNNLSAQGKEIVNIIEEDVKRPLTGWMQTIRVIWRAIPETVTPIVKQSETIPTNSNSSERVIVTSDNLNSILERIDLFLEDKEWNKAIAYCESALDFDPKNADIYLKCLLAELKVSSVDELHALDEPFDNSGNYKKAIRFGNEELFRINAELIKKKEQFDAQSKEQKALLDKQKKKEDIRKRISDIEKQIENNKEKPSHGRSFFGYFLIITSTPILLLLLFDIIFGGDELGTKIIPTLLFGVLIILAIRLIKQRNVKNKEEVDRIIITNKMLRAEKQKLEEELKNLK